MHGVVFNQLIKFIKESNGQESLDKILTSAGLNSKIYLLTNSYPDDELERIVKSASTELGVSRDDALQAFGEFITPGLLKIYGAYIKKNWKALDLLENIESTIHKTVRRNNPGAEPPKLEIIRNSDLKVTIIYRSERKMLSFGEGIITAIAKHYGEQLSVTRSQKSDHEILEIIKSK